MRFPLVAVVAFALASSASAQKVSILPFTGPGAAAVQGQLSGSLCDTADCVPAEKVTAAKKPDWKKAKKEGVTTFLAGKTVKKGKKVSLELQVLTGPGATTAKRNYPLDRNNMLSAANLQDAIERIGASSPGPAPREEAQTPDVKRPEPTPAPRAEPEPVTRGEPERGTAAEPTPAPTEKKAKFLKIDVGADVVTRSLSYDQLTSSNLRTYQLPPVGQPVLGVQFFPLALMRDDLLAGLGVEVSAGFAPWIQSRVTNTTATYPTSIFRFDGGIRWDLRFIESFALVVSPYVGVRLQSFTVGAASDGSRIDGLPNISYFGLRAGLGLEVPIIPRYLVVFGRFGVLPVFGAGEIISAAYFKNGSVFGLEANAGVGVNVLPFLQIRASFEFQRYALTFKTDTTDTYVANGAGDTWLGGNLSLRFQL